MSLYRSTVVASCDVGNSLLRRSVSRIRYKPEPFNAPGRLDDAIASARRAVEIDPADTTNNISLAAILYSARRFEEALAEIETGLRGAPNHVTGLSIKVRCLAELERLDEARAVLGRILEIDPANAWARQVQRQLGS